MRDDGRVLEGDGTSNSGAPSGVLLSLNVGLPKDVGWHGEKVHTGIYKTPVDGPRLVRRLNIDGDGQGDLNGHGGEQRAVLVYQRESYEHWSSFLERDDLTPGSFGENFTVDGLADTDVCIGDRYRIGDAEFEVSQPRVTCFRVGMRLAEPRMPALLVAHHRPGFYLRVITEGTVGPGDPIVRTRTGPHALTVAATDALLYLPDRSEDDLRKAVRIPALSPGWQQSFRDLLDTDLATATVTGPAIGVEPGWSGFRSMTVTGTARETPTMTSFYLGANGPDLAPAVAGQYLTLRVPDRDGGTAVRSYSISGTPDAHTFRITVKREENGLISRHLQDELPIGAAVDVAAPRGQFTLREDNSPVLLISAGIGATPCVAMLHQLALDRSRKDIWWIHTARNPAEHVFADEAGGLLRHLPHAHAVTFYTRDHGTDAAGIDGRPTVERLLTLGLPLDGTAYLCGPAGFIGDLTTALTSLGIDPTRIHSELFSTLAAINPGIVEHATVDPHQPAGDPGTGPAITFARSGITVRWREDDASLLELAEACDIPTRWSCRSGVCHTCVTPVIAGTVAYRPDPLEPPPPGQALLCCSRPTEDLVLDG